MSGYAILPDTSHKRADDTADIRLILVEESHGSLSEKKISHHPATDKEPAWVMISDAQRDAYIVLPAGAIAQLNKIIFGD